MRVLVDARQKLALPWQDPSNQVNFILLAFPHRSAKLTTVNIQGISGRDLRLQRGEGPLCGGEDVRRAARAGGAALAGPGDPGDLGPAEHLPDPRLLPVLLQVGIISWSSYRPVRSRGELRSSHLSRDLFIEIEQAFEIQKHRGANLIVSCNPNQECQFSPHKIRE